MLCSVARWRWVAVCIACVYFWIWKKKSVCSGDWKKLNRQKTELHPTLLEMPRFCFCSSSGSSKCCHSNSDRARQKMNTAVDHSAWNFFGRNFSQGMPNPRVLSFSILQMLSAARPFSVFCMTHRQTLSGCCNHPAIECFDYRQQFDLNLLLKLITASKFWNPFFNTGFVKLLSEVPLFEQSLFFLRLLWHLF